jgi:hypothetical protein
MENKIQAKFICLNEPDFFELIDNLYERIKGKDKEDKWITGEEVMRLLNFSSPTTLQNLRNRGDVRFSQMSKKQILYDRASVDEYLEKHSSKRV